MPCGKTLERRSKPRNPASFFSKSLPKTFALVSGFASASQPRVFL